MAIFKIKKNFKSNLKFLKMYLKTLTKRENEKDF